MRTGHGYILQISWILNEHPFGIHALILLLESTFYFSTPLLQK